MYTQKLYFALKMCIKSDVKQLTRYDVMIQQKLYFALIFFIKCDVKQLTSHDGKDLQNVSGEKYCAINCE